MLSLKGLQDQFQNLREGRGLKTQSFIVFVLKGFGAVVNFLFYLIMARYWGKEGLGLYDLLFSMVSFLGIVTLFGSSKNIMQVGGQLKAENRFVELGGVYAKLLAIVLVLSLLISTALWFGGEYIATEFFKKDVLIYPIKRMGLAISFLAMFFLNLDTLRTLGALRWSEAFRNLIRPLAGLGILLLLLFVFTDIKPGHGELGIILFAQFAGWVISAGPVWNKLRSGFTLRTKKRYAKLLNTGWSLMLAMLIIMVLGVIDRVMIGRYLTLEDNGSYAVALKLILPITFVLTAVNQVVAPQIAELYFAKKKEALDALMKRSAKLIFVSSIPILMAIVLLGGLVLRLFGTEYIGARSILYILAAGYVVNVICGPVGNFLTMTGHQSAFRNLLGMAIVLNIALNYLLIPWLGVNGVAVATAVSMAVWNISGAIYVYRREDIHVYFRGFRDKE